MRIYLIVAAAFFLNGCSEKSKPGSQGVAAVPESTAYGSGYNFYRSLPEGDVEPFKKVLISWVRENHYKVDEGSELLLSKEYGPKCSGKVWIEGDTKSVFKLKHARNFEGELGLVQQATQSNNGEQESLFDALRVYYVPPQ